MYLTQVQIECIFAKCVVVYIRNPSENGVSDVDYCSNDCLMDEDVAQTIALLFVMSSMDSNAWDERTTIKNTISLYNLEGQVNAYCIVLESGNRDCGYIIVSAKGNMPIIQEYSDVSEPLFYEGYIHSEFDNSRVLYLGPLKYEKHRYDSIFTS